jgi:ATP-binding cassette, subfamily C, bacterial exporter for protease/lipase
LFDWSYKIFSIRTLLSPYRKAFSSIAVFTGVINFLMLAPMFYMMWLFDRVLNSKNELTLLMLTVIVVFFYLLWGALEAIRSYIIIFISKHIDARLNEQVYDAAFQKAMKQQGVNAVQAINDLTVLRQFVTGPVLFALFDLPWFPIFLLVLFIFSFWMGIFAAYNEILTKSKLNKANELSMQASNTAANTIRNADVLDAMGMLATMKTKWLHLHESFLEHQTVASQRAATFTSITKVFQMAVQSLIMGLGALLVLVQQITPGMMFAAAFVMGKAIMPIQMIVQGWPQFATAITSYKRLHALINENPNREYSMTLPKPKGYVQVEHLFAGPPGQNAPIVRDINIAIEPGDILAIVGPSASGKSTLAKCMIGIWHPISGKVRLDGANMHTWNREELGPHLGYLPQDIELFEGTISQNIARFTDFNPADVVAAAEAAGIHQMILKMPDGYDTRVGPGGLGLSGGQMQRVGLARALYKDPIFVVLDEPNSNLDEAGEQALAQSLMKMRQRKATGVIVTHRMGTLNTATKMLVMGEGKAKLFGPTQMVLEDLKKINQAQQLPKEAGTDQG